MLFDRGCQGEIGENVAVIDKKRSGIPQEVLHIGETSACLQQDRFVAKGERTSLPNVTRKSLAIRLRQMVRVDYKFLHPGPEEMRKGIFHQRPLMNRNQGFGKLKSERAQAGAKPCS
jgi:hypothetical protein